MAYSIKRWRTIKVCHTGRHTIMISVIVEGTNTTRKAGWAVNRTRQPMGGYALVRSSQSRHTSRCSGRRCGPALPKHYRASGIQKTDRIEKKTAKKEQKTTQSRRWEDIYALHSAFGSSPRTLEGVLLLFGMLESSCVDIACQISSWYAASEKY